MSATATDRVLRTITPIDGSVIVERPIASDAEIDATLARAADAQRRWAHVPVAERAAVCTRAVDWRVARADELGAELTSQMGRPIAHTPFEITRGFQERARYMRASPPPRSPTLRSSTLTTSINSFDARRSASCSCWRRGIIPGSRR